MGGDAEYADGVCSGNGGGLQVLLQREKEGRSKEIGEMDVGSRSAMRNVGCFQGRNVMGVGEWGIEMRAHACKSELHWDIISCC